MRRKLVLIGWLFLAAAGAVLGGQIFDHAAVVDELGRDAESMQAKHRLSQLDPEGQLVIAITKDLEPYDPALVESTMAVHSALIGTKGVVEVEDLHSSPGGMIGADNRSTMVRVELSPGADMAPVVAELRKLKAPTVLIGGEALAEQEFADLAVSDAAFGESIALGILLIILSLLFRQVMPVVIVLGSALVTVTVTLLLLRGLAEITTVSEYAVNVVTLLGLGLAVDYSLLLVWRYREDRTFPTRTVLIAGSAVALAFGGLAVFAEPLLAAMALGGLAAAIVATSVALTLVPALLPSWRPNPIGEPRRQRTVLFAVSKPVPVVVVTTLGLLLCALPFLGANLGNSEARALPPSSESRRVYEEIQQSFQHGKAAPVTVIVESDSAGAPMRDYLDKLNKVEHVKLLTLRLEMPPNVTVIDLTPAGETAGEQSRELVRAVRVMPAPAPKLVGGVAAELVDYQSAVAGKLPLVILVLFAAMGVLLFLLTGSLLIPVKALLLNALSLSATLGILVMIFGGNLDLTTPVLLFVFVFALSMDYEVFLLARITEQWRSTGDNEGSVVTGLTRSAPVVMAAAACLVVVFLGFVVGDLLPVKEIGVGMTIALILDVTVVRGLLLPATMKLLGEWNWLPGVGREAASTPHVG